MERHEVLSLLLISNARASCGIPCNIFNLSFREDVPTARGVTCKISSEVFQNVSCPWQAPLTFPRHGLSKVMRYVFFVGVMVKIHHFQDRCRRNEYVGQFETRTERE
jgi:hypothetical protein